MEEIFFILQYFAGGNRDARLVSSGVRVKKEGDRVNEAAFRTERYKRY